MISLTSATLSRCVCGYLMQMALSAQQHCELLRGGLCGDSLIHKGKQA